MMVNIFKRYICIKQYDTTDCAAACLASIAKYYGLNYPVSKIREAAGTDKQGTNAYGVIKAAKKLGFTAKGVKANQSQDLFGKFQLPAIANVIVDQKLLHYVVIYKITNKKIIVADPGPGTIVKYSVEEFLKVWTGILIILVPDVQFIKGNKSESHLTRFFRLMLHQKKLLVNIFLASVIYTVLGILGSFYFKFLLDDIVPNNLMKTLHIISIGIILLYVFKTLLSAIRTYFSLYLSQKLDIYLILGYYQHVLELPLNFFGTRKVGEIISRFMDASKIRDAISGTTLTVMTDVLMAIAGGMILYTQSTFLFGITVIIAILYGTVVFGFNKPIKTINEKQMENNAQLTSYLVESLNGIETLKAFNAEGKASVRTENDFIKLLKNIFTGGSINNFSGSIISLIASVGGVIILWAGAYEVLQGRMTLGQLLTFNALLAYFLEPIKNIINLQPTIQTALVAASRLGEILDLELEKSQDEDKKIKPSTLQGVIEFRNIDFRYGTRQLVLKDISLKIAPGEKIAFVGESGSGKTTLVKLLLNFYEYEHGEILINGYNIKDITIEKLRERIAYIAQEVFLFSGTISENLCLGIENSPIEEVIEIAKQTKAHDFINELPLRYNTYLEENGANLSGGQRQRLAITRAMLKKPDILIMDEATSNLDSITEKAIERTITEVTQGITTLIIAHRLSTIKRCDRICVIDKGQIVEIGTHKELIRYKGVYYNLWKEQLPDSPDQEADKEVEVAV